jgi:hypothetical protein
VQIAKGCGIEKSFSATTIEEFTELAKSVWAEAKGLCLIVAKIEMGTVKRPEFASMDHKFNKYTFASYIEETEKKPVLRLRSRSPFTHS